LRRTLYHLLAAAVLAACARPGPVERALSYVRQHREAEAAATLRARIAEAPDDLEARRLLVRVLAATGDLDGARAAMDGLAARLPANDPSPLVELGHAMELAHRFDEALAAYDRAALVAPASPVGFREGGLRAARWGEAEEARPRLEEAIRRGAGDAETWHALGLARLRLGDAVGARDAYRRGAAADPSDATNWLGLASVAVKAGDAEAALGAYDAVLARRPAYAPAELGRAWALGRLGRRADAERALVRAASLGAAPDDVSRARRALSGP